MIVERVFWAFICVWWAVEAYVGSRRNGQKSYLVLVVGWILCAIGSATGVPALMILGCCFVVPAVTYTQWQQCKPKLRTDAKLDIQARSGEPGARRLVKAIVLTNVGDEIETAKALREIYDLSLKDVNQLTQRSPQVLNRWISRAEADYVREKLEAVGASVGMR